MTVQSATLERIFKVNKFLHTATRNQLDNETTASIVAIRENLLAAELKVLKSKNRLLNPTERTRRNLETPYHDVPEEPILVEDTDDGDVEDSINLNEVQRSLKLFDLITEDDEGSDDDEISLDASSEVEEEPLPRMTIRLPNPNYRPIDMHPSFWKPVKYDFINKVSCSNTREDQLAFTRRQYQMATRKS